MPRGGLFCRLSDWDAVIVELTHMTGGREVVELFRNLIGTRACLSSLRSDLTL